MAQIARMSVCLLALAVMIALAGCHSVTHAPAPAEGVMLPQQPAVQAPSEMEKTSLPTYVIEPPDILLIDAIKVVPKPPYRLQPLDILQILVTGTPAGEEIAGTYQVDPNGDVILGPTYGKIRVADLTEDEAQQLLLEKLEEEQLTDPEVSLTLIASAGQEQIAGEHLVGPDGTVNLGTYGRVYVTGMTLREAKQAIETQLSRQLEDPKVALQVFAFNSKVYYIILDGSGFGDSVSRVPITGNETVLDALAQVNGLTRASTKNIWIARPTPNGGCDQILPIEWDEIVKGGGTATNYQVLPGDRIFVSGSKLVALDSAIAKLIQPAERIVGFSLLGAQSVQSFNRFPRGSNQSFF